VYYLVRCSQRDVHVLLCFLSVIKCNEVQIFFNSSSPASIMAHHASQSPPTLVYMRSRVGRAHLPPPFCILWHQKVSSSSCFPMVQFLVLSYLHLSVSCGPIDMSLTDACICRTHMCNLSNLLIAQIDKPIMHVSECAPWLLNRISLT